MGPTKTYNRFTSIIFLFLFSLGSRAEVSAPNVHVIHACLMHTVPSCQVSGKAPTYCELTDIANMEANAGMVEKINAQLDNALKTPETAKIYIAYLSFSNMAVQNKLCELGRAGVSIEIILDNGSRGQADKLLSAECTKSNNVKVSYLGGMTTSPWRLQHNKFLMIDLGLANEDVTINFSSGNLSTFGTSLHLDHWVTLLAAKNSNIVKSHFCVIQGLNLAIEKAHELKMYDGPEVLSQYDDLVASTYINSRENCFQKEMVISTLDPESSLKKEGIAAVFSPNTHDEVFKTIHNEFRKLTQKKSGYIYIAIQHFLDSRTARDLIDAARAGVDVRIVMDDDVVRGESEVQGVKEFLESTLFPEKRIKIRYIQTNSSIHQMMHNKLTILNGERIFSGAGHFTSAALRNNWENFYLSAIPDLTLQYMKYFNEIWNESVDYDNATDKKQASTPAEPLAPEFLKAILVQ